MKRSDLAHESFVNDSGTIPPRVGGGVGDGVGPSIDTYVAADEVTKTCSRCSRELPLSAFYRMSSSPNGRQYACIECKKSYNEANQAHTRDRHRAYCIRTGRQGDTGPSPRRLSPGPWDRGTERLRVYGLTRQAFETLLLWQGERCAICFRSPAAGRVLAIDHDHETGMVRGLLCTGCNSGLGLLGDNAGSVRRALAYLGGVA